jgi:hypothetical protein
MLLVETYTHYDVLQEEKGKGPLKLRGLFQKWNAKNENGRVYPENVLKRECDNYQRLIKERRSMGELEHPEDPKLHLDRVSHLVTELAYTDDGDINGTLEVISTPCGKILEELINSGVKVGISSRGVGSVQERGDFLVVQEDYKMLAFDVVAEPSTEGAFPQRLSEDIIRFINETKSFKPENFKKALVGLIDKFIEIQS